MTIIILQFCVVFYLISAAFGEISVYKLRINILTPNSLSRPDFETELGQALKTDKNFYAQDEVALGANAAAAGLALWISFTPAAPLASLAAILPITQMALSEESDFKEPLAKVIADRSDYDSIQRDLTDIENYSKQIFRTIKELNDYLKDPNGRSRDGRAYMIAKVEGIQSRLEDIIRIFLNGNSKFWLYPQLAAYPLLGLSVLISEFAPVRDYLLNNEFDESIISCLMKETLQRYTPKIIRWRLNQIGLRGAGIDLYRAIAAKVRTVIDHPELIFNGDPHYFTKHPGLPCHATRQCDPNAESYSCFIDDIQEDTFADDYPEKHNYGCLYEYSMLVRMGVEDIFGKALNLMQKSCSSNAVMGQRNTNRLGWWSFEHLHAVAKETILRCNLITRDCNPTFTIFINGLPALSRSFDSVTSFDIGRFRSPKIPKASSVRFEMFHLYGGDTKINMLDKTLSIQQLTERPHVYFSEDENINSISLEHSEWQDDINL